MENITTLLSWGPEGWLDDFARGVLVTVSLALATLPFGLLLGFLMALAKQSEEPTLRLAGNVYTTIFRGLPELVTLFLIYFGLALPFFTTFFPNLGDQPTSFIAGMISLAVVFSSFSSEVFLSAFRAIPRGQYEGGYAIGLPYSKTMRLIILPQLVRIALPGLSNLWLILLKDTALVSAIGLADTTRIATIASRVAKEPFLFFSFACFIYLILAIISSFGFRSIEKAVGAGERGR